MRTYITLIFITSLFVLSSCCIGAKEEHLGNNIYLSEYDNVDRRILYQEESCSKRGTEIVPMTVLEIAHNSNWIIAKTTNKIHQSDFTYWIIKNSYDQTPDPKSINENTIKFDNYNLFKSYLKDNNIQLELKIIK